jgi:hypothetical protein
VSCRFACDVGVIAVAAHIAPDLVLADGTGLPDDSDPDLAALEPLIEDDLFHDEPNRNLLNARRAIAAGAWPGIAKTELTLISHRT